MPNRPLAEFLVKDTVKDVCTAVALVDFDQLLDVGERVAELGMLSR